MEVWMLIASFAAGYVGSIYSWPWIRAKFLGAEAEAEKLRDRAADVIKAARGR